MSKALIKSSGGRRDNVAGVIPAACSAVIPGLGQLINGDTDKAIGVFVVAAVSASSFIGAIPLIGSIAGLVWGATWIYGVADGYLEGRKKR
jgi:TM2 domain-containing membrane protein YozV